MNSKPTLFASRHPITAGLLAANLGIFAAMAVQFDTLGFTTGQALQCGALYPPLLSRGEIWRLLTAMFLHGGILHVLMNMYFLYQLGPHLEAKWGQARFSALYLFSGLEKSVLKIPYKSMI